LISFTKPEEISLLPTFSPARPFSVGLVDEDLDPGSGDAGLACADHDPVRLSLVEAARGTR